MRLVNAWSANSVKGILSLEFRSDTSPFARKGVGIGHEERRFHEWKQLRVWDESTLTSSADGFSHGGASPGSGFDWTIAGVSLFVSR